MSQKVNRTVNKKKFFFTHKKFRQQFAQRDPINLGFLPPLQFSEAIALGSAHRSNACLNAKTQFLLPTPHFITKYHP